MNRLPFLVLAVCLCLSDPARGESPPAFRLNDGDRVVLLGNTLIEREQRYGYWETRLTIDYPARNVTFRNLGWSGDTVWGEARAGFDSVSEGYRRLVDRTLATKPTVIILGYGTNESFAGEAGLARFEKQLNKLLDDLGPSRARIVLLAPPQFEKARWPAGHFDQRQCDLKRYAEVIRQVANRRGLLVTDEFCQRYGPAEPLTDNGMHLTAYGYWRTAGNLVTELRRSGGTLKRVELDGLTPVRVLQEFLPGPPVPPGGPSSDQQADSLVVVRGLKPGKYTLEIDGRAVHTADAATWMNPPALGVTLVPQGPSLDQAEKLRRAIVEKNRLYFYRWRPANETYLFGFRKHEQGQNAREIPEFDPLVDRLEQEIARLRKPVPHTYQLVPAAKEQK